MCENIDHLRLCRPAHQAMAERNKEAPQVSCKYRIVKTLAVKNLANLTNYSSLPSIFVNFTISVSLPVVSQLPVSQQC